MTSRILTHVAVWSIIFGFWLVVTRSNQPTWPVAIVATLILTTGSAVAVYTDWYYLRSRFTRWTDYLGWLVFLIITLSLVTVPLIQVAYDIAGVPSDVRFGFWTNMGLESIWYAVHVAIAAVVRAIPIYRKGQTSQ